ncbi:chemotaxis protein CheX [Sulfurimonas lithotrophica]|uniref:Chemotaxis protein CheX n=1 Tax=Sulfurimonas lithotrophica TaxID=2590022 RepID=A0A5P8P190_9BACT|nr:chemotaxis protein CheX [Sulfurimonas lithotrophica]QFR49357.1 chemotaxis protein CheX [Sulfurimonas lithotrophica]
MFNTIIEAAKNFCVHQIRDEFTLNDTLNKDRTLIAYIDLDTHSGNKYRVYISADKSFIQKVSYIFLEEDESDDETLQDMLLETANLIVGSAKVLAEESNNSYSISTPFFEKDGSFDYEYDNIKTIQVQNDKLSIAIKEL